MLETEEKLNSPESLYAGVLNKDELEDFLRARGLEGLDDEIALFRVKIKGVLSDKKVDVRLLVAATGLLVKLVKTRREITPENHEDLKQAIGKVLEKFVIPLGIPPAQKSE